MTSYVHFDKKYSFAYIKKKKYKIPTVSDSVSIKLLVNLLLRNFVPKVVLFRNNQIIDC